MLIYYFFLREIGKITLCMEKAFIVGKMEGNMKENINMIKNMGSVFIFGLIKEGMKGSGNMANNMEKDSIF